jgi:hypothetical protein
MTKWMEYPTKKIYNSNGIITESFQFSNLFDNSTLTKFKNQTGLADIYWETTYCQKNNLNITLAETIESVDGFVIFLHGCNGSHYIWEDLPIRLIEQHKNIICLNPDIHGFGKSPFIDNLPSVKYASMPAAMETVEYWLSVIGLWPAVHHKRKPFYLFVGHSMGGGMLFYKDEFNWLNDIYGCYMMGPSMFYNDFKRRFLYKMVAIGNLIPYITPLKNLSADIMVWSVMNGSSHVAKSEHSHYGSYRDFQTVSATMNGISLSPKPFRTDWSQFKIVMGHRDIVASPKKMLNYVEQLGFESHQIRIVLGDHYFFSHDENSPDNHKNNRQIVLEDLVNFCCELTSKI